LIHEIEMAERSFVNVQNNSDEGGVKLDPRAETTRLQKLYDTARADQQANYPDLYVSTGATAAKDSKNLAAALEEAKAETMKVQSEMMAKMEAFMAKLGDKVDAKVENAIQDVGKA
jgi:biotin carboxyl carrier protein